MTRAAATHRDATVRRDDWRSARTIKDDMVRQRRVSAYPTGANPSAPKLTSSSGGGGGGGRVDLSILRSWALAMPLEDLAFFPIAAVGTGVTELTGEGQSLP